jgi:predicted phosphoadenosine phosphosulfate sulfurtransferase
VPQLRALGCGVVSRRGLGINVLEAAEDRVSKAFDAAGKVCVSFSGGKDSTVMLDLVAREARQRGERFGLLFIDLEAQYRHTVEHVERCFAEYADVADPYWLALPLTLRNAVSVYEPQWMCWDPDKSASWVRQPPELAITDADALPFFRVGMEFEDLVPAFAEWYGDGQDLVSFVGIRTQESLNRWRSINSKTKTRVNGWPWSTRHAPASWNAYPIYDWQTEDIWTYHAARPDVPRNRIYDLMHQAGLTIHQARICQPYGDDQRRGLWLFHLLEPETWGRVVARVNGANQGALYAQEAGNILGNQKVTRPEGHTWESFAKLLVDSMPEATAEHYRNKIHTFTTWWEHRGFPSGIPDEADPKLEAARRAPSWRRVCKALLRNDYWCKGLSFSPHKSASSYAKYKAIMNRRRDQHMSSSPADRWEQQCILESGNRPRRPTAKQLALIVSLTGGSSSHQAYQAIAQVVGVSVSRAKRAATRDDATRTIEYLKHIDNEFKKERKANDHRKAD